MSNALLNQAIDDFVTNHESLQDYTDVLDDLFVHYVKSDIYAAMQRERRENLVNIYLELKALITKLIDVKENRKKKGLPP
jgi:hypothetical protein